MDSTGRNAVFGNGLRAVVAGGAGFLGSNLCARLLQRGCSVVAIDDLSTGNLRNITPLFGRGDFHFVQHDIVSPLTLRADWIFNMACCASPRRYRRDPEKTMRACTDGVLNLLREAQSCHARIFQASTGEVYGEPEVHPQAESYRGSVDPDGPRACHEEGNRCAEAMFFDFKRMYGVDIKVARIFNTYGPQMRIDDGSVVSNFIVQALRNEPLTVNSDGSQGCSFCYVDDLVDGVMRLMAAPKPATGPVNLGNPAEIAIAELARRIIELAGSSSRIVRRPMPVDDPGRRCPDISLATTTLSWTPRVSLDEGLARTIAWFDGALRHVRQSPSPSEADRAFA